MKWFAAFAVSWMWASSSSAFAQTTFDDVHPIYRAHCSDCHSTQGNGAFNVANRDIATAYADSPLSSSYALGQTKGFATLVRIQNGEMPLGAGCSGNPSSDAGNPACLTALEQARIQSWIQGGQLGPRPVVGTTFCFGDGSGTACPCLPGGADGGCANTISFLGGKLVGAGTASVSNDTFVLRATRIPNGPALFFQGTARVAGGAGAVFGDGLRCVAGSVVRLGAQTSTGEAAQLPEDSSVSVAARGSISASGGTRHYQVWYRNSPAFCQPETYNLTNGVTVTWTP